MGISRTARRLAHKKQERLRITIGRPTASELEDGIPVLRLTDGDLVEYVAINGVLYKNVFTRE